jgi:hypothetical protein
VAEKAQSKRGERERLLLAELKEAAERLGIRVREERLLREVGYRVRSGACRVRDADLVLLDRGLPTGVQIDILVEVLARRQLEGLYLSPAARQLFDGRGEPSPGTGG